MPWTRPTLSEITKRIEKGIESRLFGQIALLRRAVLRILARVFAGAIHSNYGHLDYIRDQLFVTTAEGIYLKRIGREYGINPIPGSFAVGQVTFTGTPTTVIPADTRLQSENGIEYGTLAEVVVGGGGSIVADIQSLEALEEANLSLSYTLQIISPISGIDGDVIGLTEITGGLDPEAEESYRERILIRRRNPPMGGSVTDYEIWAKEVSGVERAWVYPIYYGLGTVAIAIKSSDVTGIPSPALLTDVAGYIDTKKPVTAEVRIESITDTTGNPGAVSIQPELRMIPNDVSLQETITSNFNNLFNTHKPGTNIPISQVRNAISASGVDDYKLDDIYVDGAPVDVNTDIVLKDFEYPKLNYVAFGSL